MITANYVRNEEAVSAAVASVLLFGGVLSIIGMMLVTIIPVIQELEGSIERNSMIAQMSLLSDEVNTLGENGLPGDKSQVEISTLDGELSWARLGEGMWYSSTWHEGQSLRIDGVQDFNRYMHIRHPEGHVQAICMSDMRLGPDNHYHYTPSSEFDSILIAPSPLLTAPLGPVIISQGEDEYRLNNAEVLELNSIEPFSSNHELISLGIKGEHGATYIDPIDRNKANGQGKYWHLPLPEGNTTVQLLSENSMAVDWSTPTEQGNTNLVKRLHPLNINHWTHTFNLEKASIVTIVSSSEAQLIIVRGEHGLSHIPGLHGSFLSQSFNPPFLEGELLLTNPSDNAVTINWRQGSTSVAGNSSTIIKWPPATSSEALRIDTSKSIMMSWRQGSEGLSFIPATDTGSISGGAFSLDFNGTYEMQLQGINLKWMNSTYNSTLNQSVTSESIQIQGQPQRISVFEGDTMRMLRQQGNSGILNINHDGYARCKAINSTASGWIEIEIPWQNMAGRPELDIISSWQDGRHFSSMELDIIGDINQKEHHVIGTAWAFHLSRLTYKFTSSISGLEVAWIGGALVTNHPELDLSVLRAPLERGGPGPRFATTIPAMHPLSNGVQGQGVFELEIDLASRVSLASQEAFEIRRGWYGPYGEPMVAKSSTSIDGSEDWAVYPGQLELLNDYIGWVPVPSHAASEAVWHTGGEPIQFTLQIANLDALLRDET